MKFDSKWKLAVLCMGSAAFGFAIARWPTEDVGTRLHKECASIVREAYPEFAAVLALPGQRQGSAGWRQQRDSYIAAGVARHVQPLIISPVPPWSRFANPVHARERRPTPRPPR